MKQNHTSKPIEEADIMMHTCNLRTKEAEAERSHGLGQPALKFGFGSKQQNKYDQEAKQRKK